MKNRRFDRRPGRDQASSKGSSSSELNRKLTENPFVADPSLSFKALADRSAASLDIIIKTQHYGSYPIQRKLVIETLNAHNVLHFFEAQEDQPLVHTDYAQEVEKPVLNSVLYDASSGAYFFPNLQPSDEHLPRQRCVVFQDFLAYNAAYTTYRTALRDWNA